MKTKREEELELEVASLKGQVDALDRQLAALRAVAPAVPGLGGFLPPVQTLPQCAHDFPTHMVGPIACTKCELRIDPTFWTTCGNGGIAAAGAVLEGKVEVTCFPTFVPDHLSSLNIGGDKSAPAPPAGLRFGATS